MSKKITSPAELNALRERAVADIEIRAGAKDMQITVHMSTCGIAAGARDVLMALMSELGDAKATNVTIRQAGCAGLCDREPMISLADKSGEVFRYGRLNKDAVRKIVADHVGRGQPVLEFLIR